MPCRKTATYNGATGSGKPSGGGFATEAECLQACQEGACCEGTTCSVKPQCQCQGAGKVFKGVGTVCSPNPCAKTTCQGFDLCGWCPSPCPQEIQLRLSNCTDTDYGSGFESMNGTYSLALQPVVPGLGVRFYSITLPGFKSVTLRFSCIGNATRCHALQPPTPYFRAKQTERQCIRLLLAAQENRLQAITGQGFYFLTKEQETLPRFRSRQR